MQGEKQIKSTLIEVCPDAITFQLPFYRLDFSFFTASKSSKVKQQMVLETNPFCKKNDLYFNCSKRGATIYFNSSFPISSSRFKTNIYSFLVTCTHILPLPSLHFRKALTYFLASCLGLALILSPLYIKTKLQSRNW